MYDVKCHKLAELFVYDDERFENTPTSRRLAIIATVAQAIQDAIESELEDAATQEEPDADYERLAARDRLDGFSRTGGKDWT